jgi:hypothetical protein
MASYAYESITVADTAIGFTTSKITDSLSLYGHECREVVGTVETAPIRFKVDGGTPTTDEGHLLYVGDQVICDGKDALKFRAIRQGSTSGVLKVTYSR